MAQHGTRTSGCLLAQSLPRTQGSDVTWWTSGTAALMLTAGTLDLLLTISNDMRTGAALCLGSWLRSSPDALEQVGRVSSSLAAPHLGVPVQKPSWVSRPYTLWPLCSEGDAIAVLIFGQKVTSHSGWGPRDQSPLEAVPTQRAGLSREEEGGGREIP